MTDIGTNGTHPAYQGMRSTLVGIGVNLILAITKGTAGYLGNSYALVADAIESTSDVVSSLIVWIGLRVSAKPPDDNHPYGHGKAEPIAAVIVSMFLFAAAIGIAVYSLSEIRTPHHAPAPFTLAVLLVVVLVKETLFRYVFTVGQDVGSTAVKGDAWHHRSDAITSAAAFVGILIALIGGKGWESADDWAALCASAIIAFNAYRIFTPGLLELTDVAPDASIEETVRTVALTVDNVMDLDRCRVRKVGFDLFVDLEVIVDGNLTVQEGHRIAHQVQDAIRAELPSVVKVLVHIEPDSELLARSSRL